MTDREFFAYTVGDELPRFERVYQALPPDKLDYRPDAKSKTALELAVYIAAECATFGTFLKNGEVNFMEAMKSLPQTTAAALMTLQMGLNEGKMMAEKMSDPDWDSQCKMMGGSEPWVTTKGKMAWGLLLDLIHHRGQLSTYLRPMGGKVPSIYGPSADSA